MCCVTVSWCQISCGYPVVVTEDFKAPWLLFTKFGTADVPPFIRPLLLGKNPFSEPEILSVSAFLKNCAGGSNCNPPAIAR